MDLKTNEISKNLINLTISFEELFANSFRVKKIVHIDCLGFFAYMTRPPRVPIDTGKTGESGNQNFIKRLNQNLNDSEIYSIIKNGNLEVSENKLSDISSYNKDTLTDLLQTGSVQINDVNNVPLLSVKLVKRRELHGRDEVTGVPVVIPAQELLVSSVLKGADNAAVMLKLVPFLKELLEDKPDLDHSVVVGYELI